MRKWLDVLAEMVVTLKHFVCINRVILEKKYCKLRRYVILLRYFRAKSRNTKKEARLELYRGLVIIIMQKLYD